MNYRPFFLLANPSTESPDAGVLSTTGTLFGLAFFFSRDLFFSSTEMDEELAAVEEETTCVVAGD